MKNKKISWDLWAIIILIIYALLQARDIPLFPRHFDIYYHLLTAWGFIKAGGYAIWDFWQYAPIGRPHLYPPLFHIILAFFMKAGIDKILLARLFIAVIPVIFLFTLWNFIRRYFSPRLAFLILIVTGSSFSFYTSLSNHIPSTIAMILAFFALGEFFNKRFLRAGLLMSLLFYTHMITSWFFISAFLIYVFLDRRRRRGSVSTLITAFIFSLPILIHQSFYIRSISSFNFNELHFCEFKTIDYILAAFGLVLLSAKESRYKLFLALFIASFIYVKYPSRFFSSEGYLPIAILSAVSIDSLCENFVKARIKILVISIILFILVLSPTIAISHGPHDPSFYKIYPYDSAFMNIISGPPEKRAASKSAWFNTYILAADAIKDNSSPDDIIYCTEGSIGLALAVLSERATSNYLLPEVYPAAAPDAMADSRITAILKYHAPEWVQDRVDRYGLKLIGKTAILDLYSNPSAMGRIQIKKALIPFKLIFIISILWVIIFIFAGKKRFNL